MQIIENHKDVPDDNATKKMTMWMKQRWQDWQEWRAQQKEEKPVKLQKTL
jgi:hypothetical protein